MGTSNPAKKDAVRSALIATGVTVKGTDDFGVFLDITEDGTTVQENARKKCLAYAQALRRPVLSIDNALYLDGLPAGEQPGINTRHIGDRDSRATDEELLAYYAEQIRRLGGQVDGYWQYALCIADENGRLFERTFTSHRTFVSEPSPSLIPGYPLESIQIEPGSGRYISEMTPEEQAAFWQATIGKELCDFVQEVQRSRSIPVEHL